MKVLLQEVDGELLAAAGGDNPVAFALNEALQTANATEFSPELSGKHLRVVVEVIDELTPIEL